MSRHLAVRIGLFAQLTAVVHLPGDRVTVRRLLEDSGVGRVACDGCYGRTPAGEGVGELYGSFTRRRASFIFRRRAIERGLFAQLGTVPVLPCHGVTVRRLLEDGGINGFACHFFYFRAPALKDVTELCRSGSRRRDSFIFWRRAVETCLFGELGSVPVLPSHGVAVRSLLEDSGVGHVLRHFFYFRAPAGEGVGVLRGRLTRRFSAFIRRLLAGRIRLFAQFAAVPIQPCDGVILYLLAIELRQDVHIAAVHAEVFAVMLEHIGLIFRRQVLGYLHRFVLSGGNSKAALHSRGGDGVLFLQIQVSGTVSQQDGETVGIERLDCYVPYLFLRHEYIIAFERQFVGRSDEVFSADLCMRFVVIKDDEVFAFSKALFAEIHQFVCYFAGRYFGFVLEVCAYHPCDIRITEIRGDVPFVFYIQPACIDSAFLVA